MMIVKMKNEDVKKTISFLKKLISNYPEQESLVLQEVSNIIGIFRRDLIHKKRGE